MAFFLLSLLFPYIPFASRIPKDLTSPTNIRFPFLSITVSLPMAFSFSFLCCLILKHNRPY